MDKTRVIEVLNDLARINNDRSEGYERAMDELGDNPDADIIETFSEIAHKSRLFKNELSNAVLLLEGEPAEGTTGSGNIYRFWVDLKSAFTGGNKKSVLESCEFEDDAALKAYDEALEEEIEYPKDIRNIILNQRELLENSHDTVKQYKDAF